MISFGLAVGTINLEERQESVPCRGGGFGHDWELAGAAVSALMDRLEKRHKREKAREYAATAATLRAEWEANKGRKRKYAEPFPWQINRMVSERRRGGRSLTEAAQTRARKLDTHSRPKLGTHRCTKCHRWISVKPSAWRPKSGGYTPTARESRALNLRPVTVTLPPGIVPNATESAKWARLGIRPLLQPETILEGAAA